MLCRYCNKELNPKNNYEVRAPDGTIRGYICEDCANTFSQAKVLENKDVLPS